MKNDTDDNPQKTEDNIKIEKKEDIDDADDSNDTDYKEETEETEEIEENRGNRGISKKIYLKRNLGQKSYYLLSIYKLHLTCTYLSSFHVSKRQIIHLPCLFRVWEGLLYLEKSSLLREVCPFSGLGHRNFFGVNKHH